MTYGHNISSYPQSFTSKQNVFKHQTINDPKKLYVHISFRGGVKLNDILTSQFFHTFSSQSFVMKIFMNTNETTYIQFNIHLNLHLKKCLQSCL
jgi:hypothetical protein